MAHLNSQPSRSKYFSSPENHKHTRRLHEDTTSHTTQLINSSVPAHVDSRRDFSAAATKPLQHSHSYTNTKITNIFTSHRPNAQEETKPSNAVMDLLPFCTTDQERPLSKEQVIGLSDVAGSLKEVVLLALRASVDGEAARVLEEAVGKERVASVVEFWADEYVVE